MDFNVRDKVFYTRSNGVRVPAMEHIIEHRWNTCLPTFGLREWFATFGWGHIKTCMPTHASFSIFHNLCCGDKNGISPMAHGNTFLLPFGQRKWPLRLMKKMMIPISAKFAAKGTPPNAAHVTFTCVQVACMDILVRLRFPSSP